MNLEAISGIKQSAQACAKLRAQCLKLTKPGIRLSDINENAKELISLYKAESNYIRANKNWHIHFGVNNSLPNAHTDDIELSDTDTLKIAISLNIKNWKANCTDSIYLGAKPVYSNLIIENKNAVIETCHSLCPGLMLSDIEQALKLHHCKYKYAILQPPYTELDPNLKIKQRLKAGDLLSVNCVSSHLDQLTDLAMHEETILITANGTEILTSDQLSVS